MKLNEDPKIRVFIVNFLSEKKKLPKVTDKARLSTIRGTFRDVLMTAAGNIKKSSRLTPNHQKFGSVVAMDNIVARVIQ